MVTRIHAAGPTGQRSPGLEAAIAVWHAESPDSRERYGTGMPNGVVTASPGTYYTDTAGTNGAWRWLKTSGTGNTGWTVVFGDTGWREITPNSGVAAGSVRVKRTNHTISVRLVGVQLNTAAGLLANLAVLPGGFRVYTDVWAMVDTSPASVSNDPQLIVVFGSGGGAIYWRGTLRGAANTGQVIDGEFAFVTTDAWPTTLPGTAV